MENTNFEYYKIDLGDIWDYEREKFIAGETNDKLAQKIIDIIQLSIIRQGVPSFGKEERDSDPGYYDRNAIAYHEADLKMKYAIEYFFHKWGCYEYGQSIIISKSDKDFDFFFALKLRQYNDNLFKAQSFLNYQLVDTFENKDNYFIKYLKIVLLQYDNLFGEGLKLQVNDFITDLENQNVTRSTNKPVIEDASSGETSRKPDSSILNNQGKKNKTERKKQIETLKIKNAASRISDKDDYNIKIWTGSDAQLSMLYEFLNGIVIEDISQKEFINHFTSGKYKNKINWIVELNVFIELFDSLASIQILNPSIIKSNNQLTENYKYVVLVSKIIQHFVFNGTQKVASVLNNVRSQFYQSNTVKSRFHEQIEDLIGKLEELSV